MPILEYLIGTAVVGLLAKIKWDEGGGTMEGFAQTIQNDVNKAAGKAAKSVAQQEREFLDKISDAPTHALKKMHSRTSSRWLKDAIDEELKSRGEYY